jgi:hypothetical protein
MRKYSIRKFIEKNKERRKRIPVLINEEFLEKANSDDPDVYDTMSMAELIVARRMTADLRSEDLRGADLTGYILTGSSIRGAIWDENTIWPKGFEPPDEFDDLSVSFLFHEEE